MAIKCLAGWAQFDIAFKMLQSIEDALSDRDNLMLCDNVLDDGLQLMDFSILDLVNTAAHFTQLLIQIQSLNLNFQINFVLFLAHK
jgi:hypothetical protein